MNIIPILDTQTIEDNTANAVRVQITPDAVASYTMPDGTVISGVTVTPPLVTTTIDDLQAQIDSITANMTTEQSKLDALNAQLTAVQDAVNTAITMAIQNGATDARTQVANLATPKIAQ